MKIALGGAQFGSDYGISNKEGICPQPEMRKILDYAWPRGVCLIDTAPAYGISEQAIGEVLEGCEKFQIVTKVPPQVESAEELVRTFEESLRKLRKPSVYGLLMHRCSELMSQRGAAIYQCLLQLRQKGLVEKIGVSVYDAGEIDAVLDRFAIDLVQLPINILDQRLILSGHLNRIKDLGIEVHARSAFLQGALLMDPLEIPAHLRPLAPYLDKLRQQARALGTSVLHLALQFVVQLEAVDHVICGVTNLAQLEEIVAAASAPLEIARAGEFVPVDSVLLNPAFWGQR